MIHPPRRTELGSGVSCHVLSVTFCCTWWNLIYRISYRNDLKVDRRTSLVDSHCFISTWTFFFVCLSLSLSLSTWTYNHLSRLSRSHIRCVPFHPQLIYIYILPSSHQLPLTTRSLMMMVCQKISICSSKSRDFSCFFSCFVNHFSPRMAPRDPRLLLPRRTSAWWTCRAAPGLSSPRRKSQPCGRFGVGSSIYSLY